MEDNVNTKAAGQRIRWAWSRMFFATVMAIMSLPFHLMADEVMPPAVGEAPLITTTPLRALRQMHGSAVLNNSLYVVGGALGFVYTNTVDVAPILPDGSLGQWRATTPIPQQRSYIWNSTLALNDILYVAGGFIEDPAGEGEKTKKSNTVTWTKAGPTGDLEPWRESPPWPGQGVSNMTAAVTPGFLHVLGGYDEEMKPSAAVYSGRIAPEGGISEWILASPLPKAVWFHNSGVLGGRVWVWGGLLAGANTSTSPHVFSCPVLSDGRLGTWREETGARLPVSYYSAACTSVGNYLVSACPRLSGGAPTSDIWFSAFDGRQLGPWQRLKSNLAVKRYLPMAPDFRRGLIYVAGGRKDGGNVGKDVFVLRLAGRDMQNFDQSFFATSSPTPSPTSPGAPPRSTEALTPGAEKPPAAPTSAFAALTASTGVPSGFYSLEQARRQAEGPPRRPTLLYFHHDSVPQCIRQKTLLSQADFLPLSRRAAFAWIEVRDSPQLVQQLGVFKVPAWILYDSSGNEVGRVLNVLSPDQLSAGIDAAP